MAGPVLARLHEATGESVQLYVRSGDRRLCVAARDAGTVACIVHGMLHGAAIFRVHNVRAAVQAVGIIDAVECVNR